MDVRLLSVYRRSLLGQIDERMVKDGLIVSVQSYGKTSKISDAGAYVNQILLVDKYF